MKGQGFLAPYTCMRGEIIGGESCLPVSAARVTQIDPRKDGAEKIGSAGWRLDFRRSSAPTIFPRLSYTQHFLTQEQQQCLDRERWLAADHMRRLNQVLAGHLSFAEVARIHEHRDNFDALSAAPSHGSAAHYSPRESPHNDEDDAKKNVERFSARQAALRRLVRQTLTLQCKVYRSA